jgi:hypothetical protein
MSPGEVIRWWEGRRFFFNSVVGCTGVITCVLLIVCAFTADSTVGEPIGMPDGPLLGVFGIVFYGILVNVLYTSGWISELLLRAVTTTEKASAIGLRAFRQACTSRSCSRSALPLSAGSPLQLLC